MRLWFLILPLLYLIGSIPFSFIIVRLVSGKDLRKIGSGNVGATNAFRAIGVFWGVISLLLDALKSAGPLLLLKAFPDLLPPFLDINDSLVICGAVLVLGHVFSVFLSFKGGKGVATTFGVMLVLFPLQVLIAFVVFAALFAISHIVSLASILGAVTVFVQTFLFPFTFGQQIFLILISLFIILKHRANIARLVKRQEKKLF